VAEGTSLQLQGPLRPQDDQLEVALECDALQMPRTVVGGLTNQLRLQEDDCLLAMGIKSWQYFFPSNLNETTI
jgi:hypothetical protein